MIAEELEIAMPEQIDKSWRVTVGKGLKATFTIPGGRPRLGTDWVVLVETGNYEKRVIVRVYCKDEEAADAPSIASKITDFVLELRNRGWTPKNWQGKPGELLLDLEEAE